MGSKIRGWILLAAIFPFIAVLSYSESTRFKGCFIQCFKLILNEAKSSLVSKGADSHFQNNLSEFRHVVKEQ